MSFPLLVAAAAVGLSLAMVGAFLIQRRTGNAGWIDVVWTFSTGAAGVVLSVAPAPGWSPTPRAWLTGALVAMWGGRLGAHLWRRTAKAAHEDARYAELRREWGARAQPLMLGFAQLQAAAALVLALAVSAAARNPAPSWAWSDLAGLILFTGALAGEAVADGQLERFKSDPAHQGGVCDQGLWGWSRHPNYFFEWVVWLAFAVIALGPRASWAAGWGGLAGPALMFILLRFVSGAPATEAAMLRSRGQSFAQYQARVPMFFPAPPPNTRGLA